MHTKANPASRAKLNPLDLFLALFGQRRAIISDWPNQKAIEVTFLTLKEFQAEELSPKASDSLFDVQNLYFRVDGRKIRLCLQEYGDVTLWGNWSTVTQPASRIAEQLASAREQVAVNDAS